jgi:DNA modification methylase
VTFSLIRGDATSIPLADDSVDLVVTSPPYFALRSYTDGGEAYDGQIGSEATPQAFLEALWAVTAECRRVLKPSGSMFVNLGDKYAAGHGGSSTENGGVTIRKRSSFAAVPKTRDDLPNPPGSWGEREATGRNVVPGFRPKTLMGMPWRYAIGCIDQLGLILRAEIIWSKPNGLPESVTDRVRRSHEQWFHFTREPRYFSAVDEVREAQMMTGGQDFRSPNASGNGVKHRSMSADESLYNPLGKLPGSVWTIPTEPLRVPDHLGVDHFAAFPSEWPRRLILGWSPSGVCVACGEGRRPVVAKDLVVENEWTRGKNARMGEVLVSPLDVDSTLSAGGRAVKGSYEATITGYACACPDTTAPTRPAVILDPFSGTGTTAAVAHILGRHGVGIDLSADYLRLAEWRCNDPALRAKVLRVDKPKAVPDGQMGLFGGAV